MDASGIIINQLKTNKMEKLDGTSPIQIEAEIPKCNLREKINAKHIVRCMSATEQQDLNLVELITEGLFESFFGPKEAQIFFKRIMDSSEKKSFRIHITEI